MYAQDHPAVAAFLRVPPERAGIFTDFDGTLAAIVEEPQKARAARGAGPALARLALRYAVVAIVSGRSVRDVTARLRAPGVRFAGVHGLEEKVGRRITVLPEATSARVGIEAVAVALQAALRGHEGVQIERKGIALAVHVRRAPDPDAADAAVRPIVERIAAEAGLRVHGGRRVVEVRPAVAVDKGTLVARIAAEHHLEAAFFAGDDEGDLAAIAAVRALTVSCVVGVVTSESPPGLRAAVDVIVDGPRDVIAILRRLAAGGR